MTTSLARQLFHRYGRRELLKHTSTNNLLTTVRRHGQTNKNLTPSYALFSSSALSSPMVFPKSIVGENDHTQKFRLAHSLDPIPYTGTLEVTPVNDYSTNRSSSSSSPSSSSPLGHKKVTIVGCGHSGMATAYAMLNQGTAGTIALVDTDTEKLSGEAKDLEQGSAFHQHVRILASDEYVSFTTFFSALLLLFSFPHNLSSVLFVRSCTKNDANNEAVSMFLLRATVCFDRFAFGNYHGRCRAEAGTIIVDESPIDAVRSVGAKCTNHEGRDAESYGPFSRCGRVHRHRPLRRHDGRRVENCRTVGAAGSNIRFRHVPRFVKAAFSDIEQVKRRCVGRYGIHHRRTWRFERPRMEFGRGWWYSDTATEQER